MTIEKYLAKMKRLNDNLIHECISCEVEDVEMYYTASIVLTDAIKCIELVWRNHKNDKNVD